MDTKITVRIDSWQLERFREAAKSEGKNLSEWLRFLGDYRADLYDRHRAIFGSRPLLVS